MKPLTKTILLILVFALPGAVLMDLGIKWTGGTLLFLALAMLMCSPLIMMILEARE